MPRGKRHLWNEKSIIIHDLISTPSVALLWPKTSQPTMQYIIAPIYNSQSEDVDHPNEMCCPNIKQK